MEEQRDVLIIMFTGAGKSLCYQFPAVYTNKIAIVISPLISLSNDQAMKMEALNIPVCCLNSTVKSKHLLKERIINNDIEIYYIICEDKLIKKETFFKNVWTCRNNIYPSRLHKILKDEHLKNIILNRIDMMLLFISNTAY